MTIGTICSREVVVCTRPMSIEAAAALMRRHHVGDLVVVDERPDGRRVPVGIVTDRDIAVGVVAKGLSPEGIDVAELMAPGIVVGKESDSVFDTLAVMHAHGIRRLPIVDAEGILVGIVSADDLLDLLAEELTALARLISRQQRLELTARR